MGCRKASETRPSTVSATALPPVRDLTRSTRGERSRCRSDAPPKPSDRRNRSRSRCLAGSAHPSAHDRQVAREKQDHAESGRMEDTGPDQRPWRSCALVSRSAEEWCGNWLRSCSKREVVPVKGLEPPTPSLRIVFLFSISTLQSYLPCFPY